MPVQQLSEYACKRGNSPYIESLGDEAGWRTIYQHDVGEITYSNPFRSLAYKAHIAVDENDVDHFRTKMLHAWEVSGLADEIAKALGFNRDLVKAIACGHDVGHPPYGAIGERFLRKLVKKNKFPLHAETGYQLIRKNSMLFKTTDKAKYEGLKEKACYDSGKNYVCTVTKETLDGIKNHHASLKGLRGLPQTVEGQIIKIADDIAYITQEVEDAQRVGLYIEKEISSIFEAKLLRGFPRDKLSYDSRADIHGIVSNNISKRINAMISRIVAYNGSHLNDNKQVKKYRSRLLGRDLPILGYDPLLASAIGFIWKHFIEAKVQENSEIIKGVERAENNIEKFYKYLRGLSNEERNKIYNEAIYEKKVMMDTNSHSPVVKACLYIASLTNRGIEHKLRQLGLYDES